MILFGLSSVPGKME